jgi:hypothetical protein
VSPGIDALGAQAEGDSSSLGAGADSLGTKLSGLVVKSYPPILPALEVRLDELEEKMISHPHDALLVELVQHKVDLMRRIRTYHLQPFQTIKRKLPAGIRQELGYELADVYEHLEER